MDLNQSQSCAVKVRESQIAAAGGFGCRKTQRHAYDAVKNGFQFRVHIVIVLGIEGKESDRILPCQFPKDVIATDFSTRIGWYQSASFYPKYFHVPDAYQQIPSRNREAMVWQRIDYLRSSLYIIWPSYHPNKIRGA